jgi:aspartyl protease family protein
MLESVEKATMHQRRILILCAIACVMAANVSAAEVALVGIFPGKAVLTIDGSAPRILTPGQSVGGIKLISVESDAATIESAGKRERVQLGGQPYTVGASSDGGSAVQSITLVADSRGHFVTAGSVNGAPITFLVDTGASSVALTPEQAKSAGINYMAGQTGYARTANGVVQTWRVKLDKVTINGLTLQDVEGTILPVGSDVALLGMSFLNRLNMSRDGSTMILKRRY